jgi:3-mercaptopropionate dioxygenase
MTATLIRSPLQSLIHDVDRAVRESPLGAATIHAVAAALQPFLGVKTLLTPDQEVGDPAGYRQHLLHVAADGAFSLVALVWLPGQHTVIHDHVSWCVVGIHQGSEYETRYRLTTDGHLIQTGTATAVVGDVAGLLPPGDIHQVHNAGADTAISLHVYGADLTDTQTSIRRRYNSPIRPT